jgi:uncharacterized protein (DUF305 family)
MGRVRRAPGSRRRLAAAAIAACLAVAAAALLATRPWESGHGAAHGEQRVHEALAGTGALDARTFLDAMIPHHRMALDMARVAVRRTDDAAVRDVAMDVIANQRWEIAMMERWRREWFGATEPAPELHAADLAHLGMDHDIGAMARARPFPPAFYRAMIPHHRGAVVMARRLLAGDPRPELATLARSIATGQAIEIDRMKRFWRAWALRTGGTGPGTPPVA